MGGRPALMQALDKTWRSRALCDMPMSAACWKMTDVGSREGFTWTPLKKTVSGPCLHTLTCGHTLTSGQTLTDRLLLSLQTMHTGHHD